MTRDLGVAEKWVNYPIRQGVFVVCDQLSGNIDLSSFTLSLLVRVRER